MPHIRFSVLGIFPSPASAATGDLRGRPFGGHALAAAVPRRGLLRRQRRRRRRRHQQLDRVPHRAAVPLPGRARRLRAIHLRPGRHKVSRRKRGPSFPRPYNSPILHLYLLIYFCIRAIH